MPDGSPWPKVSVVTPSYNQAQFLEETIRSVLLQGYPDLEYIIVDGGSSDGSVEIICKYEPWLAYWVSEPDAGQSDALNKGFRLAQGEFVGWMNSDDTYEPGVIGQAVAYLVAHPSVDVVYSDCNIIDENSKIIGRSAARDFLLEEYLFHDFVPNQTALIRRQALERVGGVDPDLHCRMDHDLFLRLGRRHALQRLSGTGGNFRVCRGTKSVSNASEFSREGIVVLDKFFAVPDLPADLEPLRERVYARAHLHGACREYGAGQVEEAKRDLCRSMELDPEWWADFQRAEQFLSGWADYPVVGDPFRYLLTVFNNLPESAVALRQRRRRTIAHGAMWRCFRAYGCRDWPTVRRGLFIGVRYDPRWMLNRGVVSIGLESMLGARLAGLLRGWFRRLAGKAEGAGEGKGVACPR